MSDSRWIFSNPTGCLYTEVQLGIFLQGRCAVARKGHLRINELAGTNLYEWRITTTWAFWPNHTGPVHTPAENSPGWCDLHWLWCLHDLFRWWPQLVGGSKHLNHSYSTQPVSYLCDFRNGFADYAPGELENLRVKQSYVCTRIVLFSR